MNDNAVSCEYCNKSFIKQGSFLTHLCEPKRRWMDRDMPTNRTAYSAWKYYFSKHHPNMKSIEYQDFIKNYYYNSFMKFAAYCINIKVVNIILFLDYLVSHKAPINKWCNDTHYSKFLLQYLKLEDINDAFRRSIRTIEQMCEEENIQVKDAFKYLNGNRLCQKIYQGSISPWVLYNSNSAIDFLHNLNEDQVRIIYDIINPDIWKLKLFREQDKTGHVKGLLKDYNL